MTRRPQPVRLLLLGLALLLAVFFCAEAAHGHPAPGEHCQLCLLTHAVAALPALLALPLLLRTLFRAGEAQALGASLSRARVFRIRPPPCTA